METLNANKISTLSIKVTEEITKKSLHNFLKTSIKNSNSYFSKNTYYYFYYNSNSLTYEIIFFEKSSQNITLEPFLIVQKLNHNDDVVKVFLVNDYFIVSKNTKLLILKKVNRIDEEEISLYVNQMYKIQEFEIIEITQDDVHALSQEKYLPLKDEFYSLYPKKSFFTFSIFATASSFVLLFMIYSVYYKVEYINTTKPIKKIIQKNSTDRTINKTIELFKYIKINHITIDKVIYSNKRIKTTLFHKKKSQLLSFANSYKKNFHIKFLKFNEIKRMYTMEITIEY